MARSIRRISGYVLTGLLAVACHVEATAPLGSASDPGNPSTPSTPSTPVPVGLAMVPFIWTQRDGMREIPLPAGSIGGKATAINNLGEVVGCYYSGTFASPRAFMWSESSGFREVQALLYDGSSCASAINDAHMVTGTAIGWGSPEAFLWSDVLGWNTIPGGFDDLFANGINEAGDIVGTRVSHRDTLTVNQAFIWNARVGMRNLPSDHSTPFARAFDIDDAGNIVGFDGGAVRLGVKDARAAAWNIRTSERSGYLDDIQALCNNSWNPDNGFESDCAAVALAVNNSNVTGTVGRKAFRWEIETGLSVLDVDGLPAAVGSAINSYGDVVGTIAQTESSGRTAFIWRQDGSLQKLENLPGMKWSDATGINDHWQVVGFARR